MKSWTAIAIMDIPLTKNNIIKKGDGVTLTKSNYADYTLWHGTGLYEIEARYVKDIKILTSDDDISDRKLSIDSFFSRDRYVKNSIETVGSMCLLCGEVLKGLDILPKLKRMHLFEHLATLLPKPTRIVELSEGKEKSKRTNTRPRSQKQSIKPPRQKN